MTNQHRKEGMFLNADSSQDQREPPKGKGMLPHRRKSWHRWAIALGVLFLLGAPGRSYSEDPVLPFTTNPLMTTDFGPAKADIVLLPANFLPCRGTQIALCYYSGPGPDTTCTRTANGLFANCKCYEIPHGTYFVDINAILDEEVYLATVKKCGDDGRDCLKANSAPVCTAINNNTLFSGTDVDVISTFSQALTNDPDFAIDPMDCPKLPYAGCMTAPCKSTDESVMVGDDLLTIDVCACPTYDGLYQVGQPTTQCDLTSSNQVWSAAFSPVTEAISTFPPPGCFPDAAGPSGCPLLSAVPDSDPPEPIIPLPPRDVDCGEVCAEYKESRQENGVEVGFTCDATLCTATGFESGLVKEACSGLNDSPISEILKLETEVQCSCCASQICGCKPNGQTNMEIVELNQMQRDISIVPQCDQNGTLCGAQP